MSDGQFELNISSLSSSQSSIPAIEISAPGYESVEIIPYKGDGTAKNDLGIISLTPTTVALEQDKIIASQLTPEQVEELSLKDKDLDSLVQEQIINQTINIKQILIPSILTMVATFGITGASKLILKNQNKILDTVKNKSKCPSEESLTTLINKKNKLVKQLNNTLKVIDITTKSLGITTGLITLLNQTILTQKTTLSTIPTSTGAPGVPGVPIGTITGFDDINDNNKKLVEKLSYISSGTTSTLFLLKQVLSQAVQLLDLLDKLVEHCYPNTNQEQISIELTALTNNQSQQLSPIITNVNGFTMGVETEITDKPLKRRRAIATNKQGVVILKGEWSFSSIDQILIDELVFYIEQNNLKAD
jgi:hypothetical protein